MTKKFKLSADEIKPLVSGFEACFASDMITVEGYPVRFMYRETPERDVDSGWRFFSGFESDEYANTPSNIGIYGVNTIANYDPSIIPLLEAPIGSAFEKSNGEEKFALISDWQPPEDE
jgi:hypothetical protein